MKGHRRLACFSADAAHHIRCGAVITSNVYERVLRLECQATGQQGTAFTLEIGGEQYLVTADHLVPDRPEVTVQLRIRSRGGELTLKKLPILRHEADVAVFKLEMPITATLPCPPTADRMVMGQDAYFLGYPHGLSFHAFGKDDNIALVKKAVVSGMLRDEDGFRLILLDGFNNPGFSGGPVVLRPGESGNQLNVVAVIGGFIPEDVPQPEGWSVQANSGIITATDIDHVLEVIEGRLRLPNAPD